MKSLFVLALIGLSLQMYAQSNIKEEPIQNFYTSCKADKFTALNYKNSGIQLFYTGKYEKSIVKFNESLKRDKTLCDSWYLIGYSYQKLEDYEKSIESCNKSLELNPNSISAYIIKAYSNFYMDNIDEAIKNFEIAKEIGAYTIDPYYGLALMKYAKNDYSGAIDEINQFRKNNTKASRRDMKTINKLETKLSSASNLVSQH